MLISGLNKLSIIDYPTHVACVVFTLGCNLRCHYCHNPDFVLPERIRRLKIARESENLFFDFLTSRQGLLEGVSICGGEPTSHHDLPEFCSKIQQLGYKVKLDTNGSNPDMLQQLIDLKLIDYIAMDIKHTWEKYDTITGIHIDPHIYQKSVSIIKQSGILYEFRTTLIGGIHLPEDIDGIGKIIQGSQQYFLQRYRDGDILNAEFAGYAPPVSMLESWKQALSLQYVSNIALRL